MGYSFGEYPIPNDVATRDVIQTLPPHPELSNVIRPNHTLPTPTHNY